MRFAVVTFPGSNCDYDCFYVIDKIMQQPVDLVWHQEESLKDYDCIILPGGFSYGDYLRTGAIARFSPVMKAVEAEARKGKLILGICNGFQILTEAGLLPGALHRNQGLRFLCQFVYLRVENNQTPFTNACQPGQILKIPIAHIEGNYYGDRETLNFLGRNRKVVFRYCNNKGEITPEANPNGSLENIAGICNQSGNVMGLMPHPERAAETILGSEDGRFIFQSVLNYARIQVPVKGSYIERNK